MREIFFRGFAPNESGKETIWLNDEEIKGEWVQGLLLHKNNNAYIVKHFTVPNGHKIKSQRFRKVLKETVSQFTGLLDADNNKIWENDIVVHRADNRPVIVKYKDGQFNLLDEGYQISASKNFKVIGNKSFMTNKGVNYGKINDY